MSLNGKRIINTRAQHQAHTLDALLSEHGAVPIAYPCIEIQPPVDAGALDNALQQLASGQFAWLVLTSVNTVSALAQRLSALGMTLANIPTQVAAIGLTTAQVAQEQLGLKHITLPTEFVAESLGESLPIIAGQRVFLPESAIARSTLADALRQRGAEVQVVDAYQTVCTDHQTALVFPIDALTFTCSSTVICFCERIHKQGIPFERVRNLCVACIGDKTATTAREQGFTQIVTPDSEYTLQSLISALQHFFAQPMPKVE